MQVITNEKWLAAVSGGVDKAKPDDSANGSGGSGITGAGGVSGSTNMSQVSAGTDSSYYGAAPTSEQVAAAAANPHTSAPVNQGICVAVVSGTGTVAGAAIGCVAGAVPTEGIGCVAGANLGARFGRAIGFAASGAICRGH